MQGYGHSLAGEVYVRHFVWPLLPKQELLLNVLENSFKLTLIPTFSTCGTSHYVNSVMWKTEKSMQLCSKHAQLEAECLVLLLCLCSGCKHGMCAYSNCPRWAGWEKKKKKNGPFSVCIQFSTHIMNAYSNTLAFLLVVSRSKHNICFNTRIGCTYLSEQTRFTTVKKIGRNQLRSVGE